MSEVLVRVGPVAISKEPMEVGGAVYEVHLENEDPMLLTEEQFGCLCEAMDMICAAGK